MNGSVTQTKHCKQNMHSYLSMEACMYVCVCMCVCVCAYSTYQQSSQEYTHLKVHNPNNPNNPNNPTVHRNTHQILGIDQTNGYR